MGDNMGSQGKEDSPPPPRDTDEEEFDFSKSKPGDPSHHIFQQLLILTEKMNKVDKIDNTTARIADDMEGLMAKTAKVEKEVGINTGKIKNLSSELTAFKKKTEKDLKNKNDTIKTLGEEVSSLRALVEKQGQELASVKQFKEQVLEELKPVSQIKEQVQESAKNNNEAQKYVEEMHKLVTTQRAQVDSFQNTTDTFKQSIVQEVDVKVDVKVDQVSRDLTFNSLRGQAFNSRRNLILTGLKEEDVSPLVAVKDFLKKTLKVTHVSINEAYRIGRQPDPESSYCRPIVIIFASLADRNKVWRKRTPITSEDGLYTIRIQADLPKKIREHMPMMYKIQKAASELPDYKTAAVRNYQVVLHGKEFSPQRLEQLPLPLRPSTLSAPRSASAVAFFSKYTMLSNHYVADFKVQGLRFQSVEQFLAFRRAKLSDQQFYIQKALRAKEPVVAKSILHALKDDHVPEWDRQVQAVAEEGIRAKFKQNPKLRAFLVSTQQRQLGEASKNPRWGVGMTLDDPDILDTSKWSSTGNLLGSTLMKIRDEIRDEIEREKDSSTIREPDQI